LSGHRNFHKSDDTYHPPSLAPPSPYSLCIYVSRISHRQATRVLIYQSYFTNIMFIIVHHADITSSTPRHG
jgi:hypothetical protein